ncbi:MAG: hypothetical protein Q9195_000332 [Heterodermia aff. obscurata]
MGIYLADYEAVFGEGPDTAYEQHTIDQIIRNRRILEDELFVDRLLKALGVKKPHKLFPPRANEDLEKLHENIIASDHPEHQKQSILYYILKGLPPDEDTPTADDFAKQCYLPDKYKTFMDGIWHLDMLQLEQALSYLSNPILTPTFAEEILYTFCRHSSPNDNTLPIAYYNTGMVSFQSRKVLELFFTILCRASITEAFFFSRARGELSHQTLFERLIDFALSTSHGTARSPRSIELISLPLNDMEESWLEEYLTAGRGSRLPGARDTVIMRGLALGRHDAISSHDRNRHSRKIRGMDWATLDNSMKHILEKDLPTT